MKIMFIALPKQISTGVVSSVFFKSPPITYVWLSAFLQLDGHESVILDAYSRELTKDEIIAEVAAVKPDMLGFTSFTCEYPDAVFMANTLRAEFKDILIAVGGYHANSIPRDFFIDSIDYVFSGEAEKSLPDLMNKLDASETDFSKISGLHFRDPKTNEWVSNLPSAFIPDFNDIPLLPYELISDNHYNTWWKTMDPKVDKYMATVSGKGCPMGCSFCDISKTEGKQYRCMDAERTIEEFIHLKEKFGYNNIELRDPFFTIDLKRVAKIAQGLIDRNVDVEWGFSSTINRIKDQSLLELLSASGCRFIFFGVESGNPEILMREKKVTREEVIKVIKMVRKAGIHAHCGFILGLEDETEATIKETIDLAIRCKPNTANFTIAVPYPGTEIYRSYDEKKYIKTYDWGEYRQENPIFETEHIKKEMLMKWLDKAHRQFFFRPAYLVDRLLSIRSFRQFKEQATIGIKMFFNALSYKS